MAETTKMAPSTGWRALQTDGARKLQQALDAAEAWAETQRDQLPLWLPVAFGLGIALWFVLPVREAWIAVLIAGVALALSGVALGYKRRTGAALFWLGVMTSIGCAHIWLRAENMGSTPLARPALVALSGKILKVEHSATTGKDRLTIAPDPALNLPGQVRISADPAKFSTARAGMTVQMRARLMPPAPAALPGSYDFARAAWFKRLGATGSAVGPIIIVSSTGETGNWRQKLSAEIKNRAGEETGGIAVALATGDQGHINADDQQAMRASGLAHLLSVSGLHISAMIGTTMLLTLRLLAFSPFLALRWPLPLIAAGVGAAAGIGYTLLSGAEVPAVRACVAALLVLLGIALGREALTLRSVAVGALIVLIFWPESLVGPSFQLSFAAITSLIALHESAWAQRHFGRREEPWLNRLVRNIGSLLASGLVVEIALAPIALYHFHQSGLYGALANIVAIPLTTFVIMPLEALALAFDGIGLGAPFWWLLAQMISILLWLARTVAELPGALALVPNVPISAYAAILLGGLWMMLWSGRLRWAGAPTALLGAVWAFTQPSPDILITGDGRHAVARGQDGRFGLLRERAGEYVQDTLAERSGVEALDVIDSLNEAQCSADSCVVDLPSGDRGWRVLATRSRNSLPWSDLVAACAASDIVISDRRLPEACRPRWIKADAPFLDTSGGLAISLDPPSISTVFSGKDDHPWRRHDVIAANQ